MDSNNGSNSEDLNENMHSYNLGTWYRLTQIACYEFEASLVFINEFKQAYLVRLDIKKYKEIIIVVVMIIVNKIN